MPSFTATHTAKEVADYVKRQFGDESGVQVTDADIIRWINYAQRDVFAKKEPLKSIATANLVGGQNQYTWPPNILQVQSLRVNNAPVKMLSFQTAEEYILDRDISHMETGQPQIWYEYGGQFFFWPMPDQSSTNGIQIFYIPAPTAIDSITDTLTIPDTYFNALIDYVVSQAYELDENFDAAQLKAQSFSDYMDDKDTDGAVEHSTYPTITVLADDL